MIDKAKGSKKPIVFITDERKEDWIWRVKGRDLGPRPELVEEMNAEAGQGFHLYSPATFVRHAKAEKGGEIDADVLAELQPKIRKVRRKQRDVEPRRYRYLPPGYPAGTVYPPSGYQGGTVIPGDPGDPGGWPGSRAYFPSSQVVGDHVELSLHAPDVQLAGIVVCAVTAPNGQLHEDFTPGFPPGPGFSSATTLYPYGFPSAPHRLEAGAHRVQWSVDRIPVAHDVFVV
jgi:hypothetical protein